MATEDLTFRFNVTGNAVPQFQKVQKQVRAVDRQVKRTTSTVRAHANQYDRTAVSTNKWAKGALQQAGFQIGDYAVQVANGTSKMQAFGQQGAQLLGIFGPVGAVLGAAVAIFSAVGVAADKSGQQIGNMGSALGVLQEPLSSVAASVKSLGGLFGNVFPVIVQNIDTALIAAGLFGGYMAVRYVAQLAAATVATTTFTGAMYSLGVAVSTVKKILLRFLPVAIFVGLAKIIELFIRLKKGAGSFGEALGLLKDVVLEVFDRMVMAASAAVAGINGKWQGMKAGFVSALAVMQDKWAKFLKLISSTAFKVPGLEGLANKIAFDAATAGQAASDMQNTVDKLDAASDSAAARSSALFGGALSPLESWQALKDAVAAGTEEVKIFGDASVEANEKAGGSAENAAKKIKESKEKINELADSISQKFGDAFMSVVEGTKSAKDAFRDMARAIIKELFDVFVVKKITGFISGAISGMFGGVGANAGIPEFAIANSFPKFAGGGYTGNGARAGGLDGKGGFMAMMHPRETVVDHTKGQSGGGGVVVNQTINVSTGVQQTVRTEIKSLMPQIAESAKSAVVDAKRRGGSYGRAFA